MKCNGDSDCPAAWVCDDREQIVAEIGMAVGVNPTDGE
jgi:hypothetical protein